MPETKHFCCSRCQMILGEYDTEGRVIFKNHKVEIPVNTYILCKGRQPQVCNTVNWVVK